MSAAPTAAGQVRDASALEAAAARVNNLKVELAAIACAAHEIGNRAFGGEPPRPVPANQPGAEANGSVHLLTRELSQLSDGIDFLRTRIDRLMALA